MTNLRLTPYWPWHRSSGFRGVNDTAELDSELHNVINTAESDSVVSMTQYIFAHIVENQKVQICMQNLFNLWVKVPDGLYCTVKSLKNYFKTFLEWVSKKISQ